MDLDQEIEQHKTDSIRNDFPLQLQKFYNQIMEVTALTPSFNLWKEK
jgi:hypothetical protein